MFTVVLFATSNFISPELTNIFASLASAAALVALLRVWSPRVHDDSTVTVARPGGPAIAGAAHADTWLERRVAADEGRPLSKGATFRAFVPYIIIIVELAFAAFTQSPFSSIRRPTPSPGRACTCSAPRASRPRARPTSSTG